MHSDWLYYPFGMNLFVNVYGPIMQFISLPFQFVMGTIGAYGLLELLTFPVAGYCTFLLAHYLCKNEIASFGAGLIFSFSTYHYLELKNDQINLLATQWLPLFALFLIKAFKATERRETILYTALAGAMLTATGLSDWYYLTFVVLFAGFYWLAVSAQILLDNRRDKLPLIIGLKKLIPNTVKLAVIGSIAGVVLAYFIFNLSRDLNSGVFLPTEQSGKDLDGSADLLTMFLPATYHPLYGQQSGLWPNVTLSKSGANLSVVALILCILGLVWRKRESLGWSLAGVGWFFLALGPSIRFGGENTGIPLPYRALSHLPLFSIGRYPERYVVMLHLSMAVIGGFALTALLQKLKGNVLRVSLAMLAVFGLLYLETWPGMLPAQPPIGPFPFAQYVHSDNGKVDPSKALLELPVTKHWTSDSERMLYQMYHERPILGGYISLKPIDLYRFAEQPYPQFDFLDLRGFQPDIVKPHTPQDFIGLLNYGKYGYVVVYPGDFGKPQLQQVEQMIEFIFGKGVKPDFEDKTARVYAVPPGNLTQPVTILGWGWYQLESVEGGKFQRWIQLDQKGAGEIIVSIGPGIALNPSYNLEFEAAPYQKTRHLDVLLNGEQVGRVTVEGVQKFKLDGLKLRPGENRISFRPDPTEGVGVPAEQGNSQDTRRLTIALLNISLS